MEKQIQTDGKRKLLIEAIIAGDKEQIRALTDSTKRVVVISSYFDLLKETSIENDSTKSKPVYHYTDEFRANWSVLMANIEETRRNNQLIAHTHKNTQS